MPRYTGVNHLAVATGDMDATIRFWRDLLEMPIIAGLGHPGYRQYFFSISQHDSIAFFEWDGVEPVDLKDHGAPVKGKVVFDHVSIGVESDEDLWELRDKLEAADIWVSEPVDHGFIHSIYTFDPNNMPIEFSAPVKGVDLRKHPRMTDTVPTSVTLEGSEPQKNKWPTVTQPTAKEERLVYPGEGHDFLHSKTNIWQDEE